MANFNKCIPIILKHEGGLVDHPNDTGGITNFGICLRFAQDTKDLELFDVNGDGKIDREDIKLLTKERASAGFKKYFWDKFRLDDEPSDKKALVIFDIAVNHGMGGATTMSQRALVDMGFNVKVDGLIGPITRSTIGLADETEFVDKLLKQREAYYLRIVANNPSQQVFLKGWMNRIAGLKKELEKF